MNKLRNVMFYLIYYFEWHAITVMSFEIEGGVKMDTKKGLFVIFITRVE